MTDAADLLRGLRQPDRRSCGASVLVAARMLSDPSYAAWMTPERFADEALGTHRRVTSRAAAGVPWPRALGTPPWAVARALGPRHVTRLAVLDPGRHFDRVGVEVGEGRPAALYVGNRWCPRHVVLAVPHDGAPEKDVLRVYEPASGRVLPVDRSAAAQGRMGLAGWDRLWFVVHSR